MLLLKGGLKMAKILGPEMLLGSKLAANYLDISVYQLRYAVEKGLVEPTKIIGGRRKYSVADLDEIKKRVWDDQEVIRERIRREEAFSSRWDREVDDQ
jgi:DNA-binding transcriptional MerR regulator